MTATTVRTILATAAETKVVKGILTRDGAKLIHEAGNHSAKNAKAPSVTAKNAQQHKTANKRSWKKLDWG